MAVFRISSSFRHAACAVTEAIVVAAIFVALAVGVAMTTGSSPAGAMAVDAATAPTGTIGLADATARDSSALTYGSSVEFVTTIDGRVGPKARVYVTVICEQGGTVVYQWSADRDFAFPLVQQDGFAALGRYWDPSAEASCSGSLMYKDGTGKTVILALDRVEFATAGS